MSESHGASEVQGHEAHSATGGKSSPRRLVLVTVIMVGFAALSFLPALLSRGGTGVSSTGTNITDLFIPVWITLTVSVVIISMWFTKFLMEAERYRDSEAPAPAAPHPH